MPLFKHGFCALRHGLEDSRYRDRERELSKKKMDVTRDTKMRS